MASGRLGQENQGVRSRIAPTREGIGFLLSRRLGRGAITCELAVMARNALRSGIAEAAEILVQRAECLRRDSRPDDDDDDDDEATAFYRAAVFLTRISRIVPVAEIDRMLERVE